MAMLFNYHTHSEFCDAKVSAATLVKEAYRKGYRYLGFSSHAPLPFPSTWLMSWDELHPYAATIRALQRDWSDRGLKIFLGLEIDYIQGIVKPGDQAYQAINPDFRLGSVHFLQGLSEDEFTVDEPADLFERHMSQAPRGDASIIWKQYYQNMMGLVEAGGFDILCHFDLVKKNNSGGRWFDEESPAYLDAAFSVVDRAAELDIVAEINTGGLARGSTNSPYPSPSILRRMREVGLRLTIGDDAHSPEHLGNYRKAAVEAARAAGYTSFWYLDDVLSWKEIGLDESIK
ncbi:putative Histidinol phosphate phosphatase, HisJ [uncultured Spirochaetota bacterium]|jgi:histidinol-phosphatase (PHP family)|uniref:Histidinol-phosphatase n=1 Tax=uncultured Spirochaetota bacterium TaxID=460511 RepID=A0A652ZZ71_9SPIR|nr:putative Histidinol phosphate phosphatase, HisJ [uncultured Spirochaetota bacterium]